MFEHSIYIRRRIILLLLLILIIWGITSCVRFGIRRYQNYLKYSKIRKIEGSVKQGQVLFSSLLENRIGPEAAAEIIGAIDDILDLTKLRVSDRYTVYLDENNRIVKFIYEKSPIDLYFAVRDEVDQKLKAFIPSIFLKRERLVKEFTIESSLFEAMKKVGEEDSLVFDFVDIFAWDIDFYLYPRVGDRIKVYFEKYFDAKERFVRYGRILAAQYKGMETFNAVYYEPENNQVGYYTLEGKPVEKMFLKSPLKFTGRITSYFGWRRDPFTHQHGRHLGVDFASYYGAPIAATSGGIVSFAGWRGAYGRLVTVRHSNGYTTYYGHCAQILARPGRKVSQGEVIATVGSTGRSTGPHCHYEIRLRGSSLNPLAFNQPQRKPLKGKDLEAFKVYAKKAWRNIEALPN